MPCYWPRKAWRKGTVGAVQFREPLDHSGWSYLELPCGGCIGCRQRRARDWAIRCTLELQEHDVACWATLTYSDKYLPPTLRKEHVSAYLKRLRARVPKSTIRFFASGEYGELRGRPHYHAILYGLPQDSRHLHEAWRYGHVRADPLTPAAIAYVAGYCSKKLGWADYRRGERVDRDTGEVYEYQPPFILQSRNPGIGAAARRHTRSWRDHAVWQGSAVPVPRYLHDAWRSLASEDQVEQLRLERLAQMKWVSPQQRAAGVEIAAAKQALRATNRSLD